MANTTATEAYTKMAGVLQKIYEAREAENIANWVLEFVTGKKRWERNADNRPLSEDDIARLNAYSNELLQHRPVQYVLGESWFRGMKFFVNEDVLIPRPETEELVQKIIEDQKDNRDLSILDIGAGSGCISIALKKQLPAARTTSVDISKPALEVARQNSVAQNVSIELLCVDFLDRTQWTSLSNYDVIVSNPPYIPVNEKENLDKNVVAFEPGIALFVPENDALLFYKAIAAFGKDHLNPGGKIYLEVHENFAGEVYQYLSAQGWFTILLKDIYGKERIVTATLQKQMS